MDDSTQDRAAHTPEALEVFSYFIQCDGEHAERFGVTRKGPTVIRDVFGDSRDVRKARAHLFAAAPDLLAALEGTLDSLLYLDDNIPGLVGYGVRQQRIAEARAALAKAKATPTGSNESPIVGGTP